MSDRPIDSRFGVRPTESPILSLKPIDVQNPAARVGLRAPQDAPKEGSSGILQCSYVRDLAFKVLLQVEDVFFGFELMSLCEQAEVGGTFRPKKAVKIE